MIRKIFFFILLIHMVGCCTKTGDPRQGGLFCWSESMAIERQDNLKQSLGDEEQKTHIEQSESRQLETEREYKFEEYEKQKKMLDDLDNDLENIRHNISKMEADTEDKIKNKDHLKKELGLFTLVSIGIGGILGSGIFGMPAAMAAARIRSVRSPVSTISSATWATLEPISWYVLCCCLCPRRDPSNTTFLRSAK